MTSEPPPPSQPEKQGNLWWIPLVTMVVVAAFGVWFHAAVTGAPSDSWLSLDCTAAKLPTTAEEIVREGAFFNFLAASEILHILQLAVIILGLYLLSTSKTKRRTKGGWIVVGLAAAIITFFIPSADYWPKTIELLGRAVGGYCASAATYLTWQERISAAATALLTVAVATLLTTLPTSNQDKQSERLEEDARTLADRFERLSWTLYAGTFLLVVSVMRLSALYAWIAAAEPQPTRDAVVSVAGGMLRLWGVYYSTLLAAIYLPSHLVLRHRAQRITPDNLAAKDQREWWKSAASR